MMKKKYFLCGVGGSGMLPLAKILLSLGHQVMGSDRSYDQGKSKDKFTQLKNEGVNIVAQDGCSIDKSIDVFVVSAAIEDSILDVRAAKEQGVLIKTRAEILSSLFNAALKSIGVAGTSGKSTTTGMINTILLETGHHPITMNGGAQKNCSASLTKSHDVFLSEIDESDGSISLYEPDIAVLTNISHDHKSLEEVTILFERYLNAAQKTCIVNLDDKNSKGIAFPVATQSFSLKSSRADFYASDIVYNKNSVDFMVNGQKTHINMPGQHNVENALAAVAATTALGVQITDALEALTKFEGIKRRMDVLGVKSGVTVIDDFAHNPDKIAATLKSLKQFDGRLVVMFQPHGFAPLRLMGNEIINSFQKYLSETDVLIMPEVYYAGGTVNRSVMSKDIIETAKSQNINAHWFETREDVTPFILKQVKSGDRVVVMGARDDTLTDFGNAILQNIA